MWFQEPDLEAAESVVWRTAANHSSAGWASGGELVLTAQRLVFTPHVLDALLTAGRWQVELADVTSVDVAERRVRALFSGGVRTRLRITTTRGEDLFVVSDPGAAVARISAARSAAVGS